MPGRKRKGFFTPLDVLFDTTFLLTFLLAGLFLPLLVMPLRGTLPALLRELSFVRAMLWL